MKLRFFLFIFCLVSLGFVILEVVACKDTQDSTTEVVFPSSGVSYSLVDQLFQQRCATSYCHSSTAKQADLDLTSPSYTTLMSHTPVLVLEKDTNSLLYSHLTGKIDLMPPAGLTQLTQNQITGIKTWILEGAKSN